MKVLFVLALACMAAAGPVAKQSTWTVNELAEAIQSSDTNPAALPYLEEALNELMQALWDGKPVDSVAVAMPGDIGAIITPTPVIPSPVVPVPVIPSPVVPVPVIPSPVVPVPVIPSPVVPVPVIPSPVAPVPEVPAVSGGPLVELIININQKAFAAPSPVAPAPVLEPIVPSPDIDVDSTPIVDPVTVVDSAPTPVEVVDALPEPVVVVNPAPEANPIDTIAVAAPEVNPIDLINPVPSPAVGGSDVGPLV